MCFNNLTRRRVNSVERRQALIEGKCGSIREILAIDGVSSSGEYKVQCTLYKAKAQLEVELTPSLYSPHTEEKSPHDS
jgi:hypothetical protein